MTQKLGQPRRLRLIPKVVEVVQLRLHAPLEKEVLYIGACPGLRRDVCHLLNQWVCAHACWVRVFDGEALGSRHDFSYELNPEPFGRGGRGENGSGFNSYENHAGTAGGLTPALSAPTAPLRGDCERGVRSMKPETGVVTPLRPSR